MNQLDEKKLTPAARSHLSKGSFVFPKERRYPIEDKSHARNALARVSQHGSSSEKAKVRAAVHRKYPGIDKHNESVEDALDKVLPWPSPEEMAEITTPSSE